MTQGTTRHRWTEDERRWAAECRNDADRQRLAEKLGVSVNALQQAARRWERREGTAVRNHVWTEDEDRALLNTDSDEEVEALAEKWGVDVHKAFRRRADARRRAGQCQRRHKWTSGEIATLTSFDSARDAVAWAVSRGLSSWTAGQYYRIFK